MEASIISALLEWGMAGLFIAYMVYSKFRDDQRNEALQTKFVKSIEDLKAKQEEQEEKLRNRYDLVLDEYRSEKTAVRVDISGQLTKVMDKLESLPFDNMMIQIEALSLNQRNSHRILEKIREEQKVKAMARNMSIERET
jgi:hypothetical protein